MTKREKRLRKAKNVKNNNLPKMFRNFRVTAKMARKMVK